MYPQNFKTLSSSSCPMAQNFGKSIESCSITCTDDMDREKIRLSDLYSKMSMLFSTSLGFLA